MSTISIRRDIEIRDRTIYQLFAKGVARKQIPLHIEWEPRMTYAAIIKVIQKVERRKVRR